MRALSGTLSKVFEPTYFPEAHSVADPTLDDLGPLQRQVLELLWQMGEGTVYDLLARLRPPQPPYTSVLSALQKLEKVGWASARREGRQYVYAVAKSREELDGLTLRAFVDRVFRGQTARVFQHLLADPHLSAEELAELKRLVEQRRKRGGGDV
jgi:predicted transcriptional regulator